MRPSRRAPPAPGRRIGPPCRGRAHRAPTRTTQPGGTARSGPTRGPRRFDLSPSDRRAPRRRPDGRTQRHQSRSPARACGRLAADHARHGPPLRGRAGRPLPVLRGLGPPGRGRRGRRRLVLVRGRLPRLRRRLARGLYAVGPGPARRVGPRRRHRRRHRPGADRGGAGRRRHARRADPPGVPLRRGTGWRRLRHVAHQGRGRAAPDPAGPAGRGGDPPPVAPIGARGGRDRVRRRPRQPRPR
jgi:hypothetical protein